MPRTLRPCPTPGCGALTDGGPCRTCKSSARSKRGSQPNYRQHRAHRAQLITQLRGQPNPICGEPMTATQDLDLDHSTPRALGNTDIGDRILHSACNRSAGGKLSAALRRGDDL